jgi:hypothetical protein
MMVDAVAADKMKILEERKRWALRHDLLVIPENGG